MMNTQMTFLLTMLALSLTSVRGADVPVAMFGQSGGTASLEVKENQDFIIQLSDFTSTGYHWFLDSIVPSSLAKYNGNVTGGGVTGPPYLNASFTAGLGQGKVVIEHVKPWERSNPDAVRGFANLSLVVHN